MISKEIRKVIEMKIGIMVFSYTGNTAKAAQEMKKNLAEKGHSVKIERIETDGDAQKMKKDIKFKNKPKIDPYDIIILGAPVWGFNLPPVMKEYLEDLPSMRGKRSYVYVTKQFSPHWTGGNQSVKKMRKMVESKGGEVLGSGVIAWKKSGPTDDLHEVVNDCSKLI
jgi:flavodoxin